MSDERPLTDVERAFVEKCLAGRDVQERIGARAGIVAILAMLAEAGVEQETIEKALDSAKESVTEQARRDLEEQVRQNPGIVLFGKAFGL